MSEKSRKEKRRARHVRVRKRVSGTAECPRMAVMISNRRMYVQFIDDQSERTLASASTLDRDHAPSLGEGEALGKAVAEKARDAGIRQAVVDRGGFRYHGRVRAIVEAAMAAGLNVGGAIPAAPESEAGAEAAAAAVEEEAS